MLYTCTACFGEAVCLEARSTCFRLKSHHDQFACRSPVASKIHGSTCTRPLGVDRADSLPEDRAMSGCIRAAGPPQATDRGGRRTPCILPCVLTICARPSFADSFAVRGWRQQQDCMHVAARRVEQLACLFKYREVAELKPIADRTTQQHPLRKMPSPSTTCNWNEHGDEKSNAAWSPFEIRASIEGNLA